VDLIIKRTQADALSVSQLVLNDADQHNTAVTGQDAIASYVLCYKRYEALYLKKCDADLRKAMVQVYVHILEYQAMAAHYFSLGAFGRWARNIPKIDDWTGQFQKIRLSDERCQALLRPIVIDDQRKDIFNMGERIEQHFMRIQNQIQQQGVSSLIDEPDVRIPAEPGDGHLSVLYGQFQGRASLFKVPILNVENDYELFHRIRIAHMSRYHPLYRPNDGCTIRYLTLNWLQWYSVRRIEYVKVSNSSTPYTILNT
jgi:hypothetical protein